ncbi:hypothetical protein GGR09_000169 [Bartonella heixiaziensis]
MLRHFPKAKKKLSPLLKHHEHPQQNDEGGFESSRISRKVILNEGQIFCYSTYLNVILLHANTPVFTNETLVPFYLSPQNLLSIQKLTT